MAELTTYQGNKLAFRPHGLRPGCFKLMCIADFACPVTDYYLPAYLPMFQKAPLRVVPTYVKGNSILRSLPHVPIRCVRECL